MVDIDLNHVSVVAEDIEESVAFYAEVFGMERLPTPTFEVPVAWLQCGDGQLHLFERDVSAPEYHHFGITVDELMPIYRAVRERGLLANWDDGTDSALYRLPDDAVQLYFHDPAGNLVEANHPDVAALDPELATMVTDRSELHDQSGEAARASIDIGFDN